MVTRFASSSGRSGRCRGSSLTTLALMQMTGERLPSPDFQRDYAKDARSVHNGHLRISFVLSVELQPERETSRSLSACSGWNVFRGLPLPRLKRAGSGL